MGGYFQLRVIAGQPWLKAESLPAKVVNSGVGKEIVDLLSL